jgi:hypothetical protein
VFSKKQVKTLYLLFLGMKTKKAKNNQRTNRKYWFKFIGHQKNTRLGVVSLRWASNFLYLVIFRESTVLHNSYTPFPYKSTSYE